MTQRTFTLDDIVKVFPGEEGVRIRDRFIAATAVKLSTEQMDGMDAVIHDQPTRLGLAALREFFVAHPRARIDAERWLAEHRDHDGLPSLEEEEGRQSKRVGSRRSTNGAGRPPKASTTELRGKIVNFVRRHAGCTAEDIRDGVGVKSTSTVFKNTEALIASGAIARVQELTERNTPRYRYSVAAGSK